MTDLHLNHALKTVELIRSDLSHKPSACRNTAYNLAYEDGRRKRLEEALQDNHVDKPTPTLYSHDATRQSLFNKGWQSVSRDEIRLFIDAYHAAQDYSISKARGLND